MVINNIDRIAPVITIGEYTTMPTNQDITVTASINEGTLNEISHTFMGNGRFTFIATDEAGNVTEKTVVINNIDKVAPLIEVNIGDYGVLPIGTEIIFNSTDPNSTEPVTINAKLISGTEETVVESVYTPSVGVYKLDIVAIDAAGNRSEKLINFVVYDSECGFVTGGGWINSPVGAYTIDTSLSGKATFGFVSKYKNGAAVSIGQTEFVFETGNIEFYSTSYDWIVVAGSKAQFKGKGTLNGQGEYGFMLTAIDGGLKSTDKQDRFRIKIWDIASGNIVYDNQLGTEDSSDLTNNSTAIGGGSIVIHK